MEYLLVKNLAYIWSLFTNIVQSGVNNHAGNLQIEKNNDVISYGFFSIGAHYTTGSATVISHLDVDDKISVTSDHIHVYGYYQSCLDILQIQ